MPLVGGGGSSNVAGGNPTGTGTGLTYIGKHAYAYSGLITVPGDDTVLLNFATANSYIVAKFTPIYATDAGDNAQWEVEINGEIVYSLYASAATQAALNNEITIILPSFSKVRVLAGINNDRLLGAMITGRVYA